MAGFGKCRYCAGGATPSPGRRVSPQAVVVVWTCSGCGATRRQRIRDIVEGAAQFGAASPREVQAVGGRRPMRRPWRTKGPTHPVVVRRVDDPPLTS